MDEFSGLRAEMEAAIRQDDIARDRFDRFERKWAQREALLAADDIEEPQRKTFDPQPKPQQQSAATMDAATEAKWNAWFEQSFLNWFNDRVDRLLVPAISMALNDEREEIERALGVLRSEIEILRRHTVTKDMVDGNVTPIKGRSDAA